MFERFTDRARRVMVLAQEEARMRDHDHIGAEHILLALIHESDGLAAKALGALGITQEKVQQAGEIIGRGRTPRAGHIPFTPQAKEALQLALREAMQLGHTYIGTEHILLGLIRQGDGPAAQMLVRLGADPNRVRQQVILLLHGRQGWDQPETGYAPRRSGKGGRGRKRELLSQLLVRLDSMESRLSALERHVGMGPDVRDLDRKIAQIRRDKESAIDAQDFETAAALRDKERQLLRERDSRQQEWATEHTDLPSLREEFARLRDTLRRHGIDPEDGAA